MNAKVKRMMRLKGEDQALRDTELVLSLVKLRFHGNRPSLNPRSMLPFD